MLNMSKAIKEWANRHAKYKIPKTWNLSKRRLSLKGGKPAHLTGKGWHPITILQWLCHFLEGVDNTVVVDDNLKLLVWNGNHIMTVAHDSRDRGVLLTEEEREELRVIGNLHLRLLNREYDRSQWIPYKLFHIRPKLHLLTHWVDRCSKIKSPLCGSCFMDEDWIKSVMRLGRLTHTRTTEMSVLTRYCAGQVHLVLYIFVPCDGEP